MDTRGLEAGSRQGSQIVRVNPRLGGRQTHSQGAEADREAGTFWDSEWVSRWRARLLLAESAELCD